MNETNNTPLEDMYEALALSIDRAGKDNESLFLAKLALAVGIRLGDPAVFRDCVEIALKDLPIAGEK